MIICPCSITPHDWTLTLVSVCVIFLCLIILFVIYTIMGRANTKGVEMAHEMADKVADNFKEQGGKDESVHDLESGVITIQQPGAGSAARTTFRSAASSSSASGHTADGLIKSPLPGVVLKVLVKEGQEVRVGDKVAVLEAMKMENDILSEVGGTVFEVKVSVGDSILEGAEIARIV